VFSVTTDPAPNMSFQGAPSPRAGRSDPSPGNDGFAALVDNGPPANGNKARADSSHARAQEQTASQRRSDDAAANAADGRRSRDTAAADRAARSDLDDRDVNARQRADDAADAEANDEAPPRVGATPADAAPAPSTESRVYDQPSVTDSTADQPVPLPQDAAAVTVPDAVAVPIAAATASTEAAPALPASGIVTAPLAIAAAAIAASTSAVAAMGQAKFDSTATAAAASDAGADANTAAQAAARAVIAASAGQPATPTDASPAAGTALAAAAVAVPKGTMPPKTPAAQPGTAASDDLNPAPVSADSAATATSTPASATTVAPQTAVAGQDNAGPGALDAAKADGSAATLASAANAPGRAHQELAPAGQAPIDPAVQTVSPIQPQLHSGPVAATAAALTRVTAATDAAVPLSGLALEIAVSVQSGRSRFEIRLDPAELGRIDVRIDVDRNGLVTSHLMVEKLETLSMLRQDAAQLQRALDDAGLSTGNSGLQFSLRDQSSSDQNDGGRSGPDAHRLIVNEEDGVAAGVAGRTYGRMLGSSGGVDIRV